MTRWNLTISDETDRHVKRYLESTGRNESELAQFVDETMRAEILRRTIRDIQDRNKDLSPEEADALADEAVAWARAHPS
jgi:hypothetical protein